jgi:hypothetical protein
LEREKQRRVSIQETKIKPCNRESTKNVELLIPPPSVPPQVGAKLRNYTSAWEEITSNCWVLQVVKNGMTWKWTKNLTTGVVPDELRDSLERLQLVDQEVEAMLKKGAIIEVEYSE